MSNVNLEGFVESYEQIFRERGSLKLREASLNVEAKSVGFDAATIKRVAKARIKTAEDIEREQAARAEKEALFEIYCASLGMLDGTPLGQAARERLAKEFEEKPPAAEAKPKKTNGAAPTPAEEPEPEEAPPTPKTISPDDLKAARATGERAHAAGITILRNPYVAGDPRRASWDEGWCAAAGSDGMDIPAAFRRTSKKPPEDGAEPDERKSGGPAP